MIRTLKSNNRKILVDTEDLKLLLGCGRPTAVSLGSAAGARVKINRRVFWKLDIVEKYLDEIAE